MQFQAEEGSNFVTSSNLDPIGDRDINWGGTHQDTIQKQNTLPAKADYTKSQRNIQSPPNTRQLYETQEYKPKVVINVNI